MLMVKSAKGHPRKVSIFSKNDGINLVQTTFVEH